MPFENVRTFENVNNLPKAIILLRLRAIDPTAKAETGKVLFNVIGGPSRMADGVNISSILASEQILNLINYAETAEEAAIELRRISAKENAGKAIELKRVSANQVVNDYERRVHNGMTEAVLNSQIDAATNVNELKPVLRSIVKMLYAQTKTGKTSLRLLLGVADEVMPDR